MKTTTIKDSRINRNNDAFTFLQLCREYAKTDINGSWTMTYNEFKTYTWRNHTKIDITMNFNTNEITITEK